VTDDVRNQTVHRWYTRPVLFVADVNRALGFYVDTLGFEKRWHEATVPEESARSIAVNVRSSSAKMLRDATGDGCSWS